MGRLLGRDVGCLRVRSGLGTAYACRVHNVPWPCEVGAQAGVQLRLLEVESPASPPVLARVMAERRYVLTIKAPEDDDRRDAFSWVGLIVDYLNKANEEGRRLAEAELTGQRVDVRPWQHRIEQIAAVAICASESADRILPDGLTDPGRTDWTTPSPEEGA